MTRKIAGIAAFLMCFGLTSLGLDAAMPKGRVKLTKEELDKKVKEHKERKANQRIRVDRKGYKVRFHGADGKLKKEIDWKDKKGREKRIVRDRAHKRVGIYSIKDNVDTSKIKDEEELPKGSHHFETLDEEGKKIWETDLMDGPPVELFAEKKRAITQEDVLNTSIKLYDFEKNIIRDIPQVRGKRLISGQAAQDGNSFVITGFNAISKTADIFMFNGDGEQKWKKSVDYRGPLQAVRMSKTGKFIGGIALEFVGTHRNAFFFLVDDKGEIRDYKQRRPQGGGLEPAFSPDESLILYWYYNEIHLFTTNSFEKAWTKKVFAAGDSKRIVDIHFSDDGLLIVVEMFEKNKSARNGDDPVELIFDLSGERI